MAYRIINIGDVFGDLTVLERDFSKKYKSWKCSCICGSVFTYNANRLSMGFNKKCINCKNLIPKKPSKPMKSLVGEKYGKLTVLSFYGKDKWGKAIWQCVCDCGIIKNISVTTLKSGYAKSCGCLKKEYLSKKMRTHGLSHKIPEYDVWIGIRNRCNNKNEPQYKDYGGRGIKVCERWMKSFPDFLQDMGNRPSKNHSIDRIDVNGDYSPENCRWATWLEQGSNRRDNVFYTIYGATKTQAEWAREFNVSHASIISHLKRGKSLEFIHDWYLNKKQLK